MPGARLGCLTDLQVFVTDQCSAPRLCELDPISLNFSRVLDDISQAEVVVAMGGITENCCRCIASIEPWCHMLHIIRNGEIVWQGPVVETTEGFEKTTIFCKDILAWTQERVPQGKLDNTLLHPTGQEVTDIAVDVLKIGFAEHDPCVLKNIIQTDLGNDAFGDAIRPTVFADTKVSPQNGFPAFNGTIFDWLQSLAQIGLNFTVLGTRIILGVEDMHIARIGVLTDDLILGEVEFSKKGSQMANRVFVRYQQDDVATECVASNPDITSTPCPSISEAIGDLAPGTSCYGPIERIVNDGVPFDYKTAKAAGDAYVRAGSFAPRAIEFPSGTKLSPDTPWELNDMIPGQRVDVALTELCTEVFQAFRMLEVNYNLDEGGDEQISLTLGPLDSLGQI